MLSQDIQMLADQVGAYRGDHVELSPEAVDAFYIALDSLAEQARQLEGMPVPLAAQARAGLPAAPASDNVVLLWDEARLRRRGGRHVPNPIDGGNVPGGAA